MIRVQMPLNERGNHCDPNPGIDSASHHSNRLAGLDQPNRLQLELLRVLTAYLLVIHLVAPTSDSIISQELRFSGARSVELPTLV
jgi:hypothetical protein